MSAINTGHQTSSKNHPFFILRLYTNMETLTTAEVKRLAGTADETGCVKLLATLQDLTLAVETPHDTFMQIAFAVSPRKSSYPTRLLAVFDGCLTFGRVSRS